MNKHTKTAVIVAPFLAIGGYIATDYYDQYKTDQKRYHNITVQGDCDIVRGPCLLEGAGLILEYTIKGEMTNLEANYPLGSAAIGMKGAETDKPFNLTPSGDQKNWLIDTSTYTGSNLTSDATIRLVVTAKGHSFFSEFSSTQ